MSGKKQDWVWYELITTDMDGASKFYSDVIGWHMKDVGSPGMRYRTFGTEESKREVGGIMEMIPPMAEAGAVPGWVGYLHVDDVDAATKNAEAAGARVCRQPSDIPGVGRFAVLADPQGAIFQLLTPAPQGEVPAPLPPTAVGAVGWHELGALDWEAEWAFYESQFGWTKSEAYNMGPMGTYQTFTSSDFPMSGGMMTVPENMRPEGIDKARWGFYFNVDHIQQAKNRVEASGGTVLHGPQQVPGGGWVLNAADPQGLHFSLLSRNG